MKHAFILGLVTLALTVSACGSGGAEHQQASGHPLPKYERAVLPAGEYHTTEFEPSLSFRITGDDWRFEGPSGVLGDPEHPDYLFFERVPDAEIAFFNLMKLKGVYDPRGPAGEIEPMPAPDELVGWFQHHPYLRTSKSEPVTVGGVKGVQFDVVLAKQPANHKGVCGNEPGCQDIFALSTGGSSEVFFQHRNTYIVLKDVKGVPVVIQYSDNKGVFDEFVPEAKKVLESVEWTGT